MNFNKAQKIHAAAAKPADGPNYGIGDVMFESDGETGRLVATNGRILAVVPVTDCGGDLAGMLPHQTLKAATNGPKGDAAHMLAPDEDLVRVKTKEGMIDMVRAVDDVAFPKYQAVIPDTSRDEVKVTLSAKELRSLIDALGVLGDDLGGITLGIAVDDPSCSPVSVRASDPSNDAFGVIMPISEV